MKKLMALLLALLICFAAALADTGSRPEIPQGTLNAEVMPFTPGQTYAVYSAPDSRSIRGAKGRARVSTNGWIQVFGAEGDWLLVQYAITPEHCRIGYIDRNALPQDAAAPALALEAVPAIVSARRTEPSSAAGNCMRAAPWMRNRLPSLRMAA